MLTPDLPYNHPTPLNSMIDCATHRTDKDWASQVLNWNGVSPPICDVNVAPTATNLCMAPSDTIW